MQEEPVRKKLTLILLIGCVGCSGDDESGNGTPSGPGADGGIDALADGAAGASGDATPDGTTPDTGPDAGASHGGRGEAGANRDQVAPHRLVVRASTGPSPKTGGQ